MVPDFTPDAIEDGLWLGREPRSPEDFASLRDLGVTDVLSLIPEDEAQSTGVHPNIAFRIAMSCGMALHRVGIVDFSHGDLVRNLPLALDRLSSLRARGRRVYVHCAAGLNRSPTLIVLWLASRHQMTPAEACTEVKRLHASVPDVDAVKAALRAAR